MAVSTGQGGTGHASHSCRLDWIMTRRSLLQSNCSMSSTRGGRWKCWTGTSEDNFFYFVQSEDELNCCLLCYFRCWLCSWLCSWPMIDYRSSQASILVHIGCLLYRGGDGKCRTGKTTRREDKYISNYYYYYCYYQQRVDLFKRSESSFFSTVIKLYCSINL